MVRVDAKELLQKGFDMLPEHEKMDGHPTKACFNLLMHSPEKVLDVFVITLRTCKVNQMPPGFKSAPGKKLMRNCYEIYLKETAKPENGESKKVEDKKDMKQWVEMNELLENMVLLLFKKAKETGLAE